MQTQKCIPAAVWQWFTENGENLACCSMPKCVFPENGDDSSCALCDLQTSGKLQIAAVLGNGADFHSPQALHHRNPRPAKALSNQKCVFPKWGCDSAAAFSFQVWQLSASLGREGNNIHHAASPLEAKKNAVLNARTAGAGY